MLLSAYTMAYYVECERCGATGVAYVTVLDNNVDERPGAWREYDDS